MLLVNATAKSHKLIVIHFRGFSQFCLFQCRPVAQLVEQRYALREDREFREFDSGRTNTQGLRITEEKMMPL